MSLQAPVKVTLEPRDLYFPLDTGGAFVEDTFTVENTSSCPIAVKFKTSAPKERYIVKPSAAFLEAHEALDVTVRLVYAHAGEDAGPESCEDKFIVQFIGVAETDIERPPKEFWATVDSKSPGLNYERFRGHFTFRPKQPKALKQAPGLFLSNAEALLAALDNTYAA